MPRANLDHGGDAHVAERVGDPYTSGFIDQEVLPELGFALHLS